MILWDTVSQSHFLFRENRQINLHVAGTKDQIFNLRTAIADVLIEGQIMCNEKKVYANVEKSPESREKQTLLGVSRLKPCRRPLPGSGVRCAVGGSRAGGKKRRTGF